MGTKWPAQQNEIDKKMNEFYKREDIARVLPQKRYATKEGPGYIIQVSVTETHSKFNKENQKKVSLGRFAGKRPRNVRKLTTKHFEYCCCVNCINVRNKLLTLSRAVQNKRKKEHQRWTSGKFCCVPNLITTDFTK